MIRRFLGWLILVLEQRDKVHKLVERNRKLEGVLRRAVVPDCWQDIGGYGYCDRCPMGPGYFDGNETCSLPKHYSK